MKTDISATYSVADKKQHRKDNSERDSEQSMSTRAEKEAELRMLYNKLSSADKYKFLMFLRNLAREEEQAKQDSIAAENE